MLGPLAKTISKTVNNSIKDDYLEATAQKLEKVVREYEGSELPSPEAMFDFEDYVDVTTQYTVKKDKADLKDVEEFKRLQKLVDPNQYYRQKILNLDTLLFQIYQDSTLLNCDISDSCLNKILIQKLYFL